MSNTAEDCGESPPPTFGEPWPEFNDGITYRDTIRIDGSVVTDPYTALRAGSEINYYRLPWKEPDAPYLLQLLFEDDDLIALNKPSGLQVLPGGLFQQRTILTQLQWQASKYSSSSLARQDPHPVPVHRLGRGTSGILLCARTKVAKTSLSTYFADGTSVVRNNSFDTVTRSCHKAGGSVLNSLVSIHMGREATFKDIPILASPDIVVVIKQPIGLVRYPGVANGLYVACPSGKPALSKVKVEIQSGRPHQIRIHLSFIGHPLIGKNLSPVCHHLTINCSSLCHMAGDPLYVSGGQPNCFDPEFGNESFAHDGY
ncbi:hypothetical protein C3L33_02769, partial [Rhododendron williamsianum]